MGSSLWAWVLCVGESHPLSVPEKSSSSRQNQRDAYNLDSTLFCFKCLIQVQLFQNLFQEHLNGKFAKWALGMDDILGVNISSQVLISENVFPWVVATYFRNTPLQGHYLPLWKTTSSKEFVSSSYQICGSYIL